MNTVSGLNHLTLAGGDLERSVAFYSALLGFSIRMRSPSSAYLEAELCGWRLCSTPTRRSGVSLSLGSLGDVHISHKRQSNEDNRDPA
jgi:catechol 2,3-dioxygenase-like lactoylglutathione lyase family enzyme